jgi:hypothetical protein
MMFYSLGSSSVKRAAGWQPNQKTVISNHETERASNCRNTFSPDNPLAGSQLSENVKK